jgi:hypothetical protein
VVAARNIKNVAEYKLFKKEDVVLWLKIK